MIISISIIKHINNMNINQMQIFVFHPMDYKARQREMMGVWDL